MAQLYTLIAAVRRRWFAAVASRTVGLAAFAAAVPAGAAVLVDRLLAPRGTALVVLGLAAVALAVAAAAMVVARMARRPNDRRVARFVEERASALPGVESLDDSVVSAVDASSAGPERAAIASLIVAAAMRKLDGITPAQLVPPTAIRNAALLAIAGGVALGAILVLGWPSLSRAAETARLRWFPASVTVEVIPGDVRVVAGQPLKIRARLHAGGKELTRLQPHLIVAAAGEQRTVAMSREGDAFEFPFESIDRTFTYRVTADSTTSSDYTVTALFPPRVQRIDIQYRYPAFSGLAGREEQDGGDIYAPAGTRVRVRIHSDKPIAAGQLTLAAGAVPLQSSGDRTVDAELVLARDDSYRIRLQDRDGLASDGDSEYFIRLMDDRPPDIRILRPSGDQGITPLQEVIIEAQADDDYGVSTMELVFSVGGGREHVVPFTTVSGTPIQKTGSHLLAAEDLKVRPGDVITYYARARDIGRGKKPTETQSDMFFLEVKPFSEEFVAAQSQAGAGQGGDPQIDSLIAAQKEIISATWNIERRSGNGRSAEDIAAIAGAQAELKARAERMLGAARLPRGRQPFPQQIRQQPSQSRSSEGIAAAVEAMNKVIEQLGGQRTREAIPHEMAALNGLLQAQAEVRRRQVSQASGSGGGGGNRSGQDLSALFDKELQRQQRTNYEQRSQVDERPDQRQSGGDALDRIKDLARRQEDLNERQRELARMSAEERKRQLDKLTREQQELRQQAEELSRQMAQQQQQGGRQQNDRQTGQSQSGSQSAGSQSTGGNSGMRDAAEQMRAATNEMRRDNAEGAQQSGERAAEQLRRLEQQMRGAGADAQQRHAGELQSQAQQIAQEQRRIAAEVERLEKSGGDGAEARERLAAETERLAGRVDELRRAAEAASGAKGTKETKETKGTQGAAAAAADEIQRQRIAERMRESATQTRTGGSGAAVNRQIAQALDQVVDKLGGAGAEVRQLSEELDRAREMREKLDRLEKQMAAAQGKDDGQVEKLRQQYDQELRRTRDTLARMGERSQGQGPAPSNRDGAEQRDGLGRSTPEQQEFSRSAPGTEAFKQDRSGWASLRKDIDQALEQHEAAISKRIASNLAEAKLSAGGSDRVPEAYRQSIARYYESLAKVKK